jgi:hypothetical protein
MINPDYAIKSDHVHSIHSKSALSRKLVVNKIFYRSVKISHLAAFSRVLNLPVLQGCKMTDFNGKKFSHIQTQNPGLTDLARSVPDLQRFLVFLLHMP